MGLSGIRDAVRPELWKRRAVGASRNADDSIAPSFDLFLHTPVCARPIGSRSMAALQRSMSHARRGCSPPVTLLRSSPPSRGLGLALLHPVYGRRAGLRAFASRSAAHRVRRRASRHGDLVGWASGAAPRAADRGSRIAGFLVDRSAYFRGLVHKLLREADAKRK
jgi:hypothetical protein